MIFLCVWGRRRRTGRETFQLRTRPIISLRGLVVRFNPVFNPDLRPRRCISYTSTWPAGPCLPQRLFFQLVHRRSDVFKRFEVTCLVADRYRTFCREFIPFNGEFLIFLFEWILIYSSSRYFVFPKNRESRVFSVNDNLNRSFTFQYREETRDHLRNIRLSSGEKNDLDKLSLIEEERASFYSFFLRGRVR